MKFTYPIPVKDIAAAYHLKLEGNENIQITGLNEIHKVVEGDITFVDHEKYYQKSLNSSASVIIINKSTDIPKGKAILICDNPFEVYNDLAKKHRPFKRYTGNINYGKIGETTMIEPGVTICENVTIGENCYIQAGAYIGNHTVIGNNVVIQAGSIIGTDAFYFKKIDDQYQPWHSCGRVVIEDNVSIGAGCTINKGVSGDTIVGAGSKLDCQVHLGHGVVLGKNSLLAAQVGIGGKTIIGDNVVIYGQVGIGQNIKIGDNAIILGQTGVTKDLKGDKTYFGYPAQEARKYYKELAVLRKITND